MASVANLILVEQGVLLKSDLSDESEDEDQANRAESDFHN